MLSAGFPSVARTEVSTRLPQLAGSSTARMRAAAAVRSSVGHGTDARNPGEAIVSFGRCPRRPHWVARPCITWLARWQIGSDGSTGRLRIVGTTGGIAQLGRPVASTI